MSQHLLDSYVLLVPGYDWYRWKCRLCESTNVTHKLERAQAHAQKHHEKEHHEQEYHD